MSQSHHALGPVPANPASNTLSADEVAFARARQKARLRRRIMPVLGVASVLLLWAALVYWLKVPPFIAPSPQMVAVTLWEKSGLLWTNLLPTMIESIAGFLLGNLAAIVIATVFVHKKTLEEAFFPVVVVINTIPVVAKAPILVLLLGNGMEWGSAAE